MSCRGSWAQRKDADRELTLEPVEPPPIPSSTVPFRRDPDFIERGDLLEQIRKKLSLPAARVALAGLGGVGYDIRMLKRSGSADSRIESHSWPLSIRTG